jgi:hypothetical protein
MGKQKKDCAMSILTTQVDGRNYLHELVNEDGTAVAQLSDAMFAKLRKEGVPEKVMLPKKCRKES